jgi:hypothetical protein
MIFEANRGAGRPPPEGGEQPKQSEKLSKTTTLEVVGKVKATTLWNPIVATPTILGNGAIVFPQGPGAVFVRRDGTLLSYYKPKLDFLASMTEGGIKLGVSLTTVAVGVFGGRSITLLTHEGVVQRTHHIPKELGRLSSPPFIFDSGEVLLTTTKAEAVLIGHDGNFRIVEPAGIETVSDTPIKTRHGATFITKKGAVVSISRSGDATILRPSDSPDSSGLDYRLYSHSAGEKLVKTDSSGRVELLDDKGSLLLSTSLPGTADDRGGEPKVIGYDNDKLFIARGNKLYSFLATDQGFVARLVFSHPNESEELAGSLSSGQIALTSGRKLLLLSESGEILSTKDFGKAWRDQSSATPRQNRTNMARWFMGMPEDRSLVDGRDLNAPVFLAKDTIAVAGYDGNLVICKVAN